MAQITVGSSDTIIESLQEKDLYEASFVVAKAFETNPADHIKAVWNKSQETNLSRQAAMFRILLSRNYRRTYSAKIDGGIVGCFGFTHSSHCHIGLMESAKIALPMLWAVTTSLPRVLHLSNSWGAVDPSEPHLHLSPMCVSPDCQGKGVGSDMMKLFCNIAEKEKLAAYLETGKKENVEFYKRFGFRVVAQVSVYEAQTWTMWRDAQ